jgi:dienelactone hydrolase
MKPGTIVALLFALPCAPCPRAAEAAPPDVPTAEMLRVLEPVPEGPRVTPYLRHQLDRAWTQDERRRATFAAVRTESDARRLQAQLRRALLDVIGGLPSEKTPLNARVLGEVPRDGYRILKVVFESLPGVHVPALLYLPDAPAGPKPAVLVPCGHSPLGKAFANYQEISARLAKRGYVVLCWDPVGQGERSQFWDAARGRSRYNLVCGEHAVLGNLATLAGASIARWMAWDGIRALDYLLTRPEVDGRRISITGTSGGGFQSLYIGALDERIGVVAPSCFVTALPMRMANRIFEDPDSDPEQDPAGLVSDGIDHAGLMLLAWPRPMHVAAAVKDFFPIEGTRKTVRELSAFYTLVQAPARLALAEGYHGHAYSPENQESAFAFLDRFNGLPARAGLPAVETVAPESLRCAPSGQVLLDFGGRALTEVIREHYRGQRGRAAPTLRALYRPAGETGIASWPVVADDGTPPLGRIAWERMGSSSLGDATIERFRLRHSERLTVPLLRVRGPGLPRASLLLFGFEGKLRPQDWPAVAARLAEGYEVLAFDPRALGENRMRYKATSIDDPELAAMDDDEAYLSPISGVLANHVYNALLTGRPYFFEVIEDAEVVARFAREKLGAERLAVEGRGEARALAAAIAKVLPGVTALEPAGDGAFRWSDAVEQMRESWPIAYLVPGGAYIEP